MPGAGRVVRGGKAESAGRMPADTLDRVLQCLRTSIPLVKAMKLDADLRKLLLAQMVSAHTAAGLSLVVPEQALVQRVTDEEFRKYRNLLSGITNENAS